MTGDHPLDAMRGAQQALIAALDSNDPAAVETAAETYRACAERLRGAGADLAAADLQAGAAEFQRLSDEAQARVNFLTDALQRRLARLTEAGGRGRVPLYAREGR